MSTPKSSPADPNRAKAVSFLRKKLGEEVFEKPIDLGVISTGSIAVDHITGGGFPRGKISEVFGIESSGKSTLCMSACARAQAMGLYTVFVDAERSLKEGHAASLGFDVKDEAKGLYLKPDTIEQTLQIVDAMAQEARADLIIVDSIPALVPESVLKADIEDLGQFAQIARILAGVLPRLIKIVERTQTALVFVNQLRANIETDPWKARVAAKEKSFGGYAIRFFSSMRVELKQVKKEARKRKVQSKLEAGQEDEIPVASLHEGYCFKSKVAEPYQRAKFLIRYDPVLNLWGIDNLHTVIGMAVVKNFIEVKAGGTHVYNSLVDGKTHMIRGEEKAYDWFAEHPEEIKAIRERLKV